jgi:hypothetical protein
MPAPTDPPRAESLAVPLRCDFCAHEVPGAIRLVFTWAGIQYRWCEDCGLPHAGPVELFPEPPISPN